MELLKALFDTSPKALRDKYIAKLNSVKLEKQCELGAYQEALQAVKKEMDSVQGVYDEANQYLGELGDV